MTYSYIVVRVRRCHAVSSRFIVSRRVLCCVVIGAGTSRDVISSGVLSMHPFGTGLEAVTAGFVVNAVLVTALSLRDLSANATPQVVSFCLFLGTTAGIRTSSLFSSFLLESVGAGVKPSLEPLVERMKRPDSYYYVHQRFEMKCARGKPHSFKETLPSNGVLCSAAGSATTRGCSCGISSTQTLIPTPFSTPRTARRSSEGTPRP